MKRVCRKCQRPTDKRLQFVYNFFFAIFLFPSLSLSHIRARSFYKLHSKTADNIALHPPTTAVTAVPVYVCMCVCSRKENILVLVLRQQQRQLSKKVNNSGEVTLAH